MCYFYKKGDCMAKNDCLFCKIVTGEIPTIRVYEDEHVLAFNDINPQAPQHILIIPKKHIAGVDALEEGDIHVVGEMIYAAKKIAQDKNVKEGSYRLVFNNGKLSGQAVFHIHLHLLAGRAMHWPPG